VELYAAPQLERHRSVVRAHLPGLRQLRNRIQVRIVVQDLVVELRRGLSYWIGSTYAPLEMRGFGLQDEVQCSAAPGLGTGEADRAQRDDGHDHNYESDVHGPE